MLSPNLPPQEIEHVLGLACGYAANVRQRKLILMLQGHGYIDDSGSQGEDQIFVLAGYVLPVPQWVDFSSDWQKELLREPRIDYFKWSEAQHRNGQFAGKGEFCACKILDLARVIQKHQPICLCTSLSWRDYKAEFASKVPQEVDNPYYILFYRIIELMLQCQQEIKDYEPYEKVDFTFDEQGKIGAIAVQWYYQIRSNATPEIQRMLGATPIFRDDRQIVALQAADLVAGQIRYKAQFPDQPTPALNLITSKGCERLDRRYLADLLARARST